MLLGVDVGGTFTDFALLDDGRIVTYKLPTTPADQANAFMVGIRDLGVGAGSRVVHGSTVATNALLERKGAVTALVATEGFGDVLEIGRQNRPQLYALVGRRPAPLAPAELRYEAGERIDATGAVLRPLDLSTVPDMAADMIARGVESIAICLLFSFLNPAHEQALASALAAAFRRAGRPVPSISLSSDILPEYREYERTSTTVINAYVAPLMARYVGRLSRSLHEQGMHDLFLMQSSGGIIGAEAAQRMPARLVLSGPAAGVRGAHHVAALAGFPEIITFDMGGTSTDVSLLPGRIQETPEHVVAGLPLRLPMIDIHTVGAGGGSLARVDGGGALRVGPQSAGADPGPVCYARGGATPTVTDANVALGRLPVQDFLGGRMALDGEAAERAMESLGQSMNCDGRRAALGVIRVANATMERAIRTISVERGFDPRRFTLVAFGGAGPLHACEMADALDIGAVFVPRYPGILCALGLLVADVAHDLSQTLLAPLDDVGVQRMAQAYLALLGDGVAALAEHGIAPRCISLQMAADMRYSGQSFEIGVPVATVKATRAGAWALPSAPLLARRFHRLHRQRYGHASPAEPVEIVTIRLKASGAAAKPTFAVEPARGTDASGAILRHSRAVFGAGDEQLTPVYARDALHAGNCLPGPAIVVQMDATTAIPPGWCARVDGYHNLVVTHG